MANLKADAAHLLMQGEMRPCSAQLKTGDDGEDLEQSVRWCTVESRG